METKKPWNSIRILTIGAIILLIIVAISFLRVWLRDYELRQEIARVQREVNILEKRKIESLDVLKKLQNDSYVEDRARAELQAARPGERVLVVPGIIVTSTAPGGLEDRPQSPVLSNSQQWWYYFFRPIK